MNGTCERKEPTLEQGRLETSRFSSNSMAVVAVVVQLLSSSAEENNSATAAFCFHIWQKCLHLLLHDAVGAQKSTEKMVLRKWKRRAFFSVANLWFNDSWLIRRRQHMSRITQNFQILFRLNVFLHFGQKCKELCHHVEITSFWSKPSHKITIQHQNDASATKTRARRDWAATGLIFLHLRKHSQLDLRKVSQLAGSSAPTLTPSYVFSWPSPWPLNRQQTDGLTTKSSAWGRTGRHPLTWPHVFLFPTSNLAPERMTK